MDTTNQILHELHSIGVTLTAHGENLRLEPGSQVPSELAERIRGHKGELLAFLRSEADTTDDVPDQRDGDHHADDRFEQWIELRRPDGGMSWIHPHHVGNELAKEARQKRRDDVRRANVEQASLPDAKYRVVYADPPWSYGDERQGLKGYTAAVDHYSTMSLDEICDLRVAELTLDNAVLFLWATSPLLPDALTVITAWGFTYKASFVWDKVKHNVGHYNSVRHELLLIGTRGSCLPETRTLYNSVVTIERTEHSKKPDEFRRMIQTLYPSGNRIELFARTKVEGWDVYGDQVQSVAVG